VPVQHGEATPIASPLLISADAVTFGDLPYRIDQIELPGCRASSLKRPAAGFLLRARAHGRVRSPLG
jgi:hypothetical protein